MHDADATLAPFTADLVVKLCEQPPDLSRPPVIEVSGALLQVDIVGSSLLAERIMAISPHSAADEFAIVLNSCFDAIVSSIHACGGEIVDFGGDSLLAVWEYGEPGAAHGSIVAACAAAIRLNQSIESAVRRSDIGPVSVRCAITAGQIVVAGVGGVAGDRRLFVTGTPISDLALALSKATARSIAVSPHAWTLAAGSLLGRAKNSVHFLDRVRNRGVPPPDRTAAKPGVLAVGRAQSYIPRTLRRFSESAPVEMGAELRTTTMVFCRIKPELLSDREEIHRISDVVSSVQDLCNRYHGFLETIRADDKGTSFMVAFGLPPTTMLHRRSIAVGFAAQIQELLRSLGYIPGIGIGTGRVFQGPIGASQRRQYALIGSPTILGCRLMQLSDDEILCDEATKALAEAEGAPWEFEERGLHNLKGFDKPVPAFSIRRGTSGNRGRTIPRTRLVGRQTELAIIEKQIAEVVSGRRSLTLIEGEAGVGKTSLLREAAWRAELAGCQLSQGGGDPLMQSTPYAPWRQILTELFDLPESGAGTKAKPAFRKLIAGTKLDPELLPLLNDVFGAAIPDSDKTRSLSGSARARQTQQFLVDLIKARAIHSAIVILLEDVHWIDRPSLDLCAALYQKCSRIGLLLTRRPVGSDRTLDRLLNDRGSKQVELRNLDRKALAELAHTHTRGSTLPPGFIDEVYGATQGNPLFAEQILNRGHSRDQRPHLASVSKQSGLDLMRGAIPSTVEMAILQRVDELSPAEQLLLKTASALGDSFKFEALRYAHALKGSAQKMKRHLAVLIRSGFVVERRARGSGSYEICHQLMRKVVYDLIPRHQLTELHRRIARWYETGNEGPKASLLALLAHHWHLAGVENRALAYLSRAGSDSIASGAHTEAAHFFRSALGIATSAETRGNWRGGDFRLAQWEAQLAQALWSVGELEDAQLHASRALELVGFTVPRSRTGWLLLSLRHWCTLQLPIHIGFGQRKAIRRRRQVLASGAVASIVVAQVSYYTSDALRMLGGSLLSLRHGSPGAANTSVGRSYAYLGYIAGVMRLHRTAERMFRQAQARSEADSDIVGLAYTFGGEALYHLGFGRWHLALPKVEEAVTACRKTGDPQLTEMALTLRAMLHYFRGAFSESERDFAEIFKSAKTRFSNHHLAWGAYGRAENLLPLGKTRQARRLIAVAKTLLRGQSDLHSELICHGLDAKAKLQLGRYSEARDAAICAVDVASKVMPNNFSSLEGYGAPIEVLLSLRDLDPTNGSGDRRYLRAAFSSLRNYAWIFPIGRPRLWYVRGMRSYLEGHTARASQNWRRSLAWASSLEMDYEEYRACEALLRFGILAGPESKQIAERADRLSKERGYAADAHAVERPH